MSSYDELDELLAGKITINRRIRPFNIYKGRKGIECEIVFHWPKREHLTTTRIFHISTLNLYDAIKDNPSMAEAVMAYVDDRVSDAHFNEHYDG